MKKKYLFTVMFIVSMSGLLSAQSFEPWNDGWYFQNWGEDGTTCIGSCEFSWDLYRKTYLGINPTQDCVEAPLDCAFYEIFKTCAKQGNCGGMSLLALALYKYGGYMGFCSPARFYTGTVSPDREDLHRAINIMQARQFGVEGIRNFVNKTQSGDLNNAITAYNDIQGCLSNGDFPLISIANSFIGENAHTVIPYKCEISGGKRYIYVWDSNHPYNTNQHRYDLDSANKIVITTATDWTYQSGGHVYTGGWCFCIPMSLVMRKTPQPLSVGFLLSEFSQLLTTGSASVAQISDDKGHTFYKAELSKQLKWGDIESNTAKRIPGMIRWPKFDDANAPAGKSENEIYFFKNPGKDTSGLTITMYGKNYTCKIIANGQLIEVSGNSATEGKDKIRISNIARSTGTITVTSALATRQITMSILSSDPNKNNWRKLELSNITITRGVPFSVRSMNRMEGLAIATPIKQSQINLVLTQAIAGKTTSRALNNFTAEAKQNTIIIPRTWNDLSKTEVQQVRLAKFPGRLY